MQRSRISRRDVLTASAAGIVLPASSLASPIATKKRSIRIAHLTDIHVTPSNGAPKGMEAAIEHAQGQKDKPQMILTGGDLIFDSLGADQDSVKKQWQIFHDVVKANVDIPIEHCIGNHDVFGWGDRGKFASDPRFGKKWALEELKLTKPYRSFDKAGWHFIVLDSNHAVDGNGYTARLDDEQFEWLKDDLAKTPAKTLVFVVSHIPIVGITSFFDGDNAKTGNWVIPGSWMHIDAQRIKNLFYKHKNVKLCISGHEHLLDQVTYNGVTYCCNGAVCAGWWGGDYHECTYGYTLVDLFDDGTFENRYVPYGWKTQK